MMRKRMALFAIVSFLLGNSIMAQEIDSTLAVSGRVHLLRLQKSYTLGEGLMVRSCRKYHIQSKFADIICSHFRK